NRRANPCEQPTARAAAPTEPSRSKTATTWAISSGVTSTARRPPWETDMVLATPQIEGLRGPCEPKEVGGPLRRAGAVEVTPRSGRRGNTSNRDGRGRRLARARGHQGAGNMELTLGGLVVL